MQKSFCDLCGKPAVEFWPLLKVQFPDMEWHGSKSTPGSISDTEGTWIPYVSARMIFETYNMPNSTGSLNPDICGACIAELLQKMAMEVMQNKSIVQSTPEATIDLRPAERWDYARPYLSGAVLAETPLASRLCFYRLIQADTLIAVYRVANNPAIDVLTIKAKLMELANQLDPTFTISALNSKPS